MGTQKERIEQLETALAKLTERFHFLQTSLHLLAKGSSAGSLSWTSFLYSMQLLEAGDIARGGKRPQETKNFCSQCGQKYTDRACGPTHAIKRSEIEAAINAIPADTVPDTVNHSEALHLALLKKMDSNLARCYLDLCLVAPNEDTALLDWCADNRVVDGFCGSYYAGVQADFDIDELTVAAIEEQDVASGTQGPNPASAEGEARWNLEWRKQFRNGIREMIKLQAESKAKQEADKTKPEA